MKNFPLRPMQLKLLQRSDLVDVPTLQEGKKKKNTSKLQAFFWCVFLFFFSFVFFLVFF